MVYAVYAYIFCLGAVVGSFLNVVILRYNTGQSCLKGRSKCFSCAKDLRWHELVPILSFLLQRGRCGKCGSKISRQYPAVEFLTGLLFVLMALKIVPMTFSHSVALGIYFWAVASLLIIIAVYDFRHQIIPDFFVYLFGILAFLNLFFLPAGRQVLAFWPYFWAGILFFGFFAIFWLVSGGRWMGLGDAKLALGLGWFLGPSGAVLAFLFSFWFGAVASVFLLLFKRGKFTIKSRLAFAPFLIAGSFIAFFVKDMSLIKNLF